MGEINYTQQAAWRKSLTALNETTQHTEQVCLFPEDREIPSDVLSGLQPESSTFKMRIAATSCSHEPVTPPRVTIFLALIDYDALPIYVIEQTKNFPHTGRTIGPIGD